MEFFPSKSSVTVCFVQALTVNVPFSFRPDSWPLGVFSGAWVSSARTTY
jgi:hypothetical protein